MKESRTQEKRVLWLCYLQVFFLLLFLTTTTKTKALSPVILISSRVNKGKNPVALLVLTIQPLQYRWPWEWPVLLSSLFLCSKSLRDYHARSLSQYQEVQTKRKTVSEGRHSHYITKPLGTGLHYGAFHQRSDRVKHLAAHFSIANSLFPQNMGIIAQPGDRLPWLEGRRFTTIERHGCSVVFRT